MLSRHEPRRMRAVEQFTTCRDSFQEFQSQSPPGQGDWDVGFISIAGMVQRDVRAVSAFILTSEHSTRHACSNHAIYIALHFFSGCNCIFKILPLTFSLFSSLFHFLSIFLIFLSCSQETEEASLRALESLMTEFFHSCTTNERKREIGKATYSLHKILSWKPGVSFHSALTDTPKNVCNFANSASQF